MPVFDAYVRQSRTHEHSISEAVQLESIRRNAAARGITINETVVELDVSGGKSIDQRELGRLVRKVEAGESDGLIVWKVSRFSRDLGDGVQAALRVIDAGGRVVADDLDTAQPMAKPMLGFLLGWAEEELDQRKEGWRQAKQKAIGNGAHIGPVPAGYRKGERGRLVVVTDDARKVRDAFERRAAGESFASIGRRYGWTNASKLIGNPAYLGRARCGEWDNDGAHDAIVTPDLFARANGARTIRQSPVGNTDRLLKGLARCAGCGKTLKLKTRQGQPDSYYCHDAAKEPCPARAFVNCDRLERAVGDWFALQLEARPRMVDAVAATRDLDDALAMLAAEREELGAYMEVASATDRAAFERGRAAREARLAAAQERVDDASARTTRLPAGGTLPDVWAGADVAERRVILDGWLDRVEVTRGAGRTLAGHVRVLWAGVADGEGDAGVAAL